MSPPDANPGPEPVNRPLPSDAAIVVPVRGMVLFPEVVLPITVGRSSSVAAVQQAVREQRQIVLVLQRDPQADQPGPDELYRVGTLANVLRYVTSPEGGHHLLVEGRLGERVHGPREARLEVVDGREQHRAVEHLAQLEAGSLRRAREQAARDRLRQLGSAPATGASAPATAPPAAAQP